MHRRWCCPMKTYLVRDWVLLQGMSPSLWCVEDTMSQKLSRHTVSVSYSQCPVQYSRCLVQSVSRTVGVLYSTVRVSYSRCRTVRVSYSQCLVQSVSRTVHVPYSRCLVLVDFRGSWLKVFWFQLEKNVAIAMHCNLKAGSCCASCSGLF